MLQDVEPAIGADTAREVVEADRRAREQEALTRLTALCRELRVTITPVIHIVGTNITAALQVTAEP